MNKSKIAKPSGPAIFMYCVIAITAILAILFDSQFIIIQRYNRPRLIKLIQRSKRLQKQI